MSKAPSFRLSADTTFLAQELERMNEGDEVTYLELSKRASIPVDGATSALQSARRILLRDKDMVFSPIRGVGLRRLTQSEIIKSASSEVNGIRQKARKGARKLSAVQDFSKLPNDQQLDFTIKAAVFTISGEAASRQGQNKIADVARATKAPELPLGQIAAGFLTSMQKNKIIRP